MIRESIDSIEARIIKRIIRDTGVPKTFRMTFKQYLKWKEAEK